MKKVLIVTAIFILIVAIGFALNMAGVALLFWLIDLFGKTALLTLRNVVIGAGIATVVQLFFVPHNRNND